MLRVDCLSSSQPGGLQDQQADGWLHGPVLSSVRHGQHLDHHPHEGLHREALQDCGKVIRRCGAILCVVVLSLRQDVLVGLFTLTPDFDDLYY